ncbi:ATPase [Actinomyces vulturis]|uniref:ATPase n=1 Tax=Actinomyces vulturis TaxID=1857645 RepID=UPI0008327CC0|nr:ATPase [Actinomyces vulturis]
MALYDAGDDLLRILDELDELIANARTMPMSASVIVNRDEALDLIDAARRSVPQAVRQAEGIVADADDVLSQGREEADRLILRAQEEAERLIASENVVRGATQKADEIIRAAEEKADRLRHGADSYSDNSLARLQEEVDRIADQVAAGRAALAQRLGSVDNGPIDEEAPAASSRRRAGWSVDPSRSSAHL